MAFHRAPTTSNLWLPQISIICYSSNRNFTSRFSRPYSSIDLASQQPIARVVILNKKRQNLAQVRQRWRIFHRRQTCSFLSQAYVALKTDNARAQTWHRKRCCAILEEVPHVVNGKGQIHKSKACILCPWPLHGNTQRLCSRFYNRALRSPSFIKSQHEQGTTLGRCFS